LLKKVETEEREKAFFIPRKKTWGKNGGKKKKAKRGLEGCARNREKT